MRSYIVDRVNGDKPLENESEVKIYGSVSAIESDLANLEEDQIVGVIAENAIPTPSGPEDGSMIYYDDDRSEYVNTAGPTLGGQVPTSVIDNLTGKVTVEWKAGGSGSVNRFATVAEAQAAIAIPEGQEGYIQDGGIIIIDELNQNVYGEDE